MSVRLERKGRLAIVTLDRPDRSNALGRELLGDFGRIGRELLQDPGVRACVVTGSGDRAFCAGADLKERARMTADEVRRQLDSYRSELDWLTAPDFVTLAALNGVALGGGLELALLCDLRLAHAHVTLGLPETRLGIIPGAGGTQRLTRLVGPARAKELILLGERIDAARALEIGLVNWVLPQIESILDRAIELLAPVLEGAPLALRAALDAIDEGLDLPLEQGLLCERRAYETCLDSEDRLEALQAFEEKRPPRFTGK